MEKMKNVINPSDKLTNDIKAIFLKYFPNSRITGGFSDNLGPSIHLRFTLGNGKEEYFNTYIDNDPMITNLSIRGMDKDGHYDTVTLERYRGGGVLIKSTNPRYFFETAKVPCRKTTGDEARILKAFDTYIKRLHAKVEEVAENMFLVPFDISTKL